MSPPRLGRWTCVLVAFLSLSELACVTSEVTPIGRSYPARAPGCAVDVIPAGVPSYPHVDVATARAQCNRRTDCIERLKSDACAVGAHAVYAFTEGAPGGQSTFAMFVSATLARTVHDVKATPPAPAAAPPAPAGECSPPCSPGFACRVGVCEPQCNPACETGEVCTRKRVCEPAPAR